MRKTKPKIPAPFKVYVYCTKDDGDGCYTDGTYDWLRKVPFEYVCDYIEVIQALPDKNEYDISFDVLKQSHLSQEELWEYGKGKTLYGWHISDLKIYDKPKELSEFYVSCNGNGTADDKMCISCPNLLFDNDKLNGHTRWCEVHKKKPLTRPPQSWCYVEEV